MCNQSQSVLSKSKINLDQSAVVIVFEPNLRLRTLDVRFRSIKRCELFLGNGYMAWLLFDSSNSRVI